MTRPTRNKLLFGAFWVVCLALGNVLPEMIRLPFVALVLGAALVSYIVAREFFVGRRHMKKKRWLDAIVSFQNFEKELTGSSWKQRLSFLASGLYTQDAIALARNNIGVVHLENAKLDLAEAAFRSALERDAQYAVPHVNLAVVAARKGDAAKMDAELAEAARLGLTDQKVHARVRGSLGAAATATA